MYFLKIWIMTDICYISSLPEKHLIFMQLKEKTQYFCRTDLEVTYGFNKQVKTFGTTK